MVSGVLRYNVVFCNGTATDEGIGSDVGVTAVDLPVEVDLVTD